MGSLVQTPHSEVTASLERLDKFGLSQKGLKNIRTMSPALLRQIVRIVEREKPTDGLDENTLAAFRFFSVDFKPWDAKLRSVLFRRIADTCRDEVEELIRNSQHLGPDTRNFIILHLDDFHGPEWYKGDAFKSCYEKMVSAKWLEAWSKANLIAGYCLKPCYRPDTAIQIALTFDGMADIPERLNVIGPKADHIGLEKWNGSAKSWFIAAQKIVENHSVYELVPR